MDLAAAETTQDNAERPEPATLRGTQRGLEVVVEPTASVADIADALTAQLEKSPAFFAGSDVVIRCEQPLPTGGLSRLEEIATEFELRIVELGPSAPPHKRRRTTITDDAIPTGMSDVEPTEDLSIDITEAVCAEEPAEQPVAAPPEAVPEPEPVPIPLPAPGGSATRIVVGPVRSGVVLDAPGHLVVLGDVNPGAELCAGQSVIVLGALRGIANAGGNGGNAFVFALRLAAQQLRIGEHIARGGDDGRIDTPEIAHAAGGQIIVEDYRGKLPSGITAEDL